VAKNIRVVDPSTRKGFDCSTHDWIETTRFAVAESTIQIDPAAVLAALDADRAR
jgi:hypothetical protein